MWSLNVLVKSPERNIALQRSLYALHIRETRRFRVAELQALNSVIFNTHNNNTEKCR